jgi:2-methylcitrate dehydratase PrpD
MVWAVDRADRSGITETLAKWVVESRYEHLTQAGVDIVKRSILDWIGCALVGAVRRESAVVIDYIRAEGGAYQAHVISTDIHTSSANAAFANGILGHIEDFDDSGAHPASYLTPTVLSLGEELNRSGKDLIVAWAAGYEVSTRLDNAIQADRGWHKTSICGTMGATAAAGVLLGLDVVQLRMALGIAASGASGLSANFGTMTKSFHPANAARNAIVAAKLAARGFTANAEIIEDRQGYADSFGGGKCSVASVLQFLGDVSILTAQPPTIKAWPNCSDNHRSLTGIFAFLDEHALDPDSIDRVDHYAPRVPRTGATRYQTANTGLEGKFCLEYGIAAAFIDGRVDLSTYSDERCNRGDLQQFMKKVHRHQDPESMLHSSRTHSGRTEERLSIMMNDGSIHDLALGARRSLTGDAVLTKFRENTEWAHVPDIADDVIGIIVGLEQLSSLEDLVRLLTTPAL